MIIRTSDKDFNFGLRYSDVTPKELYLNRRKFLAAGAATLGALALPESGLAAPLAGVNKNGPMANLLKDTASPQKAVTTYNNYYEFGESKYIAKASQALKTRPWSIRIDGMVAQPRTIDIDHLLRQAGAEFVRFCAEAGLIGGEWVAVDGTKFQAVASGKAVLDAAQRAELQAKLEQRIAQYLQELEAADQQQGEAEVDAQALRQALARLQFAFLD